MLKKDRLQRHKHNLHVVTHIIKLVLFRSGCSFFRCFFILLLLEDEDPQNVRSGRRGKEKWLSFRFIDNWRSYTYRARILHVLELSPSDFDFRRGLVENWKAWSNSWTNTRIFFFLYVSGRDSHFEMFSGPDFEESYPNIRSLPFCRQIRSLLVTSREVLLSRKSNMTCL